MSTGISAISFAELEGFLEDPRWRDACILPLTRERALSQKNNPHARDEEICLWLAEDDQGEVLGFAGALPASVPGGAQSMAWNTCWWVDPEKGKETAMPLLLHFLSHWEQRVAFSDMTERTHAIISQLGFCHTREEELLQSYVRIPVRKLWQDAGPAGKLLAPLTLPAAYLVNLLWKPRIRKFARLPGNLAVEESTALNDEIWNFVAAHMQHDFSRRGREEFDWILQDRWLVEEGPESRAVARRYPFSYVAGHFEMYWLLTREEGSISSAQLLSLRDGVLKVLYYFGEAADHALKALASVVGGDRRIYSVIQAHPALLAGIGSQWKISLYERHRIRRAGISGKLLEEWPPDMHMQLGDGDASFT